MNANLVLAVVVCAVVLLAGIAPGQPPRQQADELRVLIETLQSRLQQLEQQNPTPAGDQRVTQIGSGRTKTPEPAEEKQVVRIYDVSDLFAVAPPYVARMTTDLAQEAQPLFPLVQSPSVSGGGLGGGFGGGGGVFNVGPQPESASVKVGAPLAQFGDLNATVISGNLSAARTSINDLVDAITTTITPDQWSEVGGESSIATLGNALLISAKEQAHEQISTLLDSFRRRWGSLRTVSVRAHWLWLTEPQLSALVAERGADHDPPAYGVVDEVKWQTLLTQRRGDDKACAGYHAVVTCYNGQTVFTLAGQQSLLVRGITPVLAASGDKEKSGAISYSPNVAVVQQGAALQVMPLVTNNAKYVVLDVHSRVTRLQNTSAGPAPADKSADQFQQLVAALDRPALLVHRLSTTLRVPVDRTMLVGGMTFDSVPGRDEPNLYLFVKLSVQELRDDAPRDGQK